MGFFKKAHRSTVILLYINYISHVIRRGILLSAGDLKVLYTVHRSDLNTMLDSAKIIYCRFIHSAQLGFWNSRSTEAAYWSTNATFLQKYLKLIKKSFLLVTKSETWVCTNATQWISPKTQRLKFQGLGDQLGSCTEELEPWRASC